MTDSILSQFMHPRARTGVEHDPVSSDHEVPDDHGAFGFLRGSRERAVCIELRKKTGNIVAIPYSWMEKMEFDPSEGISLRANGQTIRIRGRHLNTECRPEVRLFTAICRHRVPWVQEAAEPDRMEAEGRATVIDSIDW